MSKNKQTDYTIILKEYFVKPSSCTRKSKLHLSKNKRPSFTLVKYLQ